jgi:hypothetical protein
MELSALWFDELLKGGIVIQRLKIHLNMEMIKADTLCSCIPQQAQGLLLFSQQSRYYVISLWIFTLKEIKRD